MWAYCKPRWYRGNKQSENENEFQELSIRHTLAFSSKARGRGRESEPHTFTIFPEKLHRTVRRNVSEFENKLDYIFAYKEDFWKSRILDCMMLAGHIVLLCQIGEDISIQTYDRKGKKIQHLSTDLHHASEIEKAKLFYHQGRLHIAGLSKLNGNYMVSILQAKQG